MGADLSLLWTLPFAGILLSIALFPLFAPHWWHHHFAKVSAAFALVFAIPFWICYRTEAFHEIVHIYAIDYIPFIILLFALFTISGGILIRGTLVGTPWVNALIILVGTALASWIGTTGASMLLIRPLLRANQKRRHKVHTIVFFIFLVSNIGGSLTPLGDPPLFLGFLHNVPFFWTLTNLFVPMLFAVGWLLAIYLAFDFYFYSKEAPEAKVFTGEREPLRLQGKQNFFLLAGVIGGVLLSGYWDKMQLPKGELVLLQDVGTHHQSSDPDDHGNAHDEQEQEADDGHEHDEDSEHGEHEGHDDEADSHHHIHGVKVPYQNIARELILLVMAFLSLAITSKEIRKGNEFTWFPIYEVAVLFAGIFMTIVPALLILKAGTDGALSGLITSVKQPIHYFWVTGILSSFLDNAPTYLTFFNTALGSFSPELMKAGNEKEAVAQLILHHNDYLVAIAAGAVFMGANTYIGNAPNFMVRSIAEESDIAMPSFLGFMFKYSIPILVVATFIPVTLIFFWS